MEAAPGKSKERAPAIALARKARQGAAAKTMDRFAARC